VTQPRDDVEPSPPTLESLFRTQRLPMVRLAHLITKSSAVAEEVVPEAFIRMQNNWHRADNPKAYLRTIVTNLCKTQLRRRDRERRLDQPPQPATLQPEIDETWAAVFWRVSRPGPMASSRSSLSPRKPGSSAGC
jgi:DNA-directed RNA polymerase specialized sigma24 family protein